MIAEQSDIENIEIKLSKIGTGEPAWVSATFKRIFYRDRECYIMGFFDLSDIKEAQTQQETARLEAEKASKIKSEFLANMSMK